MELHNDTASCDVCLGIHIYMIIMGPIRYCHIIHRERLGDHITDPNEHLEHINIPCEAYVKMTHDPSTYGLPLVTYVMRMCPSNVS